VAINYERNESIFCIRVNKCKKHITTNKFKKTEFEFAESFEIFVEDYF